MPSLIVILLLLAPTVVQSPEWPFDLRGVRVCQETVPGCRAPSVLLGGRGQSRLLLLVSLNPKYVVTCGELGQQSVSHPLATGHTD